MHVRRYMLSLTLGLAAMTSGAWAASPLPPEKVAAAIADRYGVKVLNVKPGEQDGQAVYLVVAMNPGGNFNEAFKVTRLVIDAATGDLVPQFRNLTSGYDLPVAADTAIPGDDNGATIRRLTFRGR